MDYLLRDSLMTGAKYGLYDLEWIINALQIDTERDRIYRTNSPRARRVSLAPASLSLRCRICQTNLPNPRQSQ